MHRKKRIFDLPVRLLRSFQEIRHMHRYLTIAFALAALFTAGTAGAHHGAAAYNLQTSKTFEATVTSFRWANPNGLI
jgi:hypothetical protein